MRELFIYYRVRPDALVAARALVAGFQARLRDRHPGLATRLLSRPAAAEVAPTWMEVYAMACPAGPGVTPEIEADVQAQAEGLRAMLDGPRRVECFIAEPSLGGD